ncbi:TetR/AcrR family transcriptional regulator [Jongsikchunia kroppenstedtii]|uniref:TetR/AcrR family transcriptional regulator n=1 Tax=Jongsikchunia kroppenstedtii TaxID=1121721 RepID=UPI00036AF5B3|nr:TetR/AcrR family transcriptional regulator [Jongsikchunia kroppenstedtii]
MTAPTRDRLVDEAMRLFGEQGYRATSVAQIEAAAGLAPGSGGLYHHFRSKELLLEAGIDRHLDRVRALRDISQIFEGLADMRSELTVLGRFTLEVLDEESQLLRIVSSELRDRPQKLTDAVEQMLADSYRQLANWIERQVPDIERAQAETTATVALNALFGYRATRDVLGESASPGDDEIVAEWVEFVASRLERLAG